MSSAGLDLLDLARRLKQERLFVSNERKEIEGLNRKVQLLSTGLLHQTWLTGQHRLSLESLSRGPLSSSFSCPFVTSGSDGDGELSDNLELLDAHKYVSGKHLQTYGDLIILLRNHPELIAYGLSACEKEKTHLLRPSGQPALVFGDVLQAIVNLYGGICGPLPTDETQLLKLLSALVGFQLQGAENPRRLLRHGSCSFSTLYRLISETIPSSRLFLVGALHQPVTQLLSSPDLLCLGTDLPAVSPASAMDTTSGFAKAATSTINGDMASLDRTERMAKLTKIFVESILDNIHAFPAGLAWLIKSVHKQLSTSYPEKDVSLVCTDLIWALLICPAVTNPEPFGVTDAPVCNQARHTLSQVANILQALALHKWEGADPRLTEYISYFDTSSLTAVLDHVLSMDSLPSERSGILAALSRRTVLMPESLLHPLFSWLKEVLPLMEKKDKIRHMEIWNTFSELVDNAHRHQSTLFAARQPPPNSSSPAQSNSGSNLSLSLSDSGGSPSHAAASILANGKRVLMNRKVKQEPVASSQTEVVSVIVFPITQQSWEWVGMLPESDVVSNKNGKSRGVPEVDSMNAMDDGEEEEREERSSLGEKRTRFSLSQDDGSIGTSDNLEAVSEAASTHSVSSSIELEDQNDNFSDMLSANVSSRGTPNVSGRNTPLSQAEQEEENENNGVVLEEDVIMNEEPNEPANNVNNINPPNLNNLNINTPNPSKQARSEIEDKFCKFEIKQQLGGDETVSLVSDTWSTDVLASDSEVGSDAQHHLLPIINQPSNGGTNSNNNNSNANNHGSGNTNGTSTGGSGSTAPANNISNQGGGGTNSSFNMNDLAPATNPDNSTNDTMSEAWSTDVAASDIERMHDFDTDDTSSVTRSDYTGRSEFEGVAYDTPRSSVSGGTPYRRQDNMADLLLFDDTSNADRSSQSSATPSTQLLETPVAMDVVAGGDNSSDSMPTASQKVNVSCKSTETSSGVTSSQPAISNVLIPEIVSPSSNQIQMSASALPVPGSSSRSGTVPKTITFDKTAERGDREWDDESGRTRRFFRNFRLPFRGRNRKTRGPDSMDWDKISSDSPSLPVPRFRKSFSEDISNPSGQNMNESSDEILAKYRRKPSLTDATDGGGSANRESSSTLKLSGMNSNNPTIVRKESVKISRSELINDARRKLRSVLSSCELQMPQPSDVNCIDVSVINLLRVEVANAIGRSDQVAAAQIQEAIRTVRQLGLDGCRKVMRLMRDDYRRRSDYISYLMRAKQGLLSTVHYLEKSTVRAKHEGDIYSHYLIKECIRVWLEEPSQAHLLNGFIVEFCQATTVDEKNDLLERFLSSLMDMFVGTKEYTEWQLSKMEEALEHNIVARVYRHALHPNGDADIHRDGVLQEHIGRLQLVVTPSHKDLKIPKYLLTECPWLPAQMELKMLAAYTTPTDKLRCIIRTASLLVNLLSSSSEKAVAADDLVPVFVFVIIKCNPPALLSTIQYITSFCGQRIAGEDQYWWTQFCSAIEFIKTMEYND